MFFLDEKVLSSGTCTHTQAKQKNEAQQHLQARKPMLEPLQGVKLE